MNMELCSRIESYVLGFFHGSRGQMVPERDDDEDPAYCLGFGAGREASAASLRAWLKSEGYETAPIATNTVSG